MEKYIEVFKSETALKIKRDEEILNSMRSNLGKLVLNDSYGKENIPEAKLGIENKEQELQELIDFYKGIPRYVNLKDILMHICNEGNSFNKQNRIRYVAEHLSGFEKIETGERIRLKGQCTTNINLEKIKQYEDKKIPADGYYIYRIIGHTGEYEIYSLPEVRELERELLSESGSCNLLISEVIVLYNGKVKRYGIVNKRGTQLTKGQVEKMNEKTVRKLKVVWDA